MGELQRIAIDAMGGDVGVDVMIGGVAFAHRRNPALRFLLAGDQALIEAALDKHLGLRAACEVVHSDVIVAATERPSTAIRKKGSSMGLAIEAVKSGKAGAAVSAGNTGALMAMSKLALRTIPGINRPALAALLPTMGANDLVMLDLGANTECDARNLVQFAVMGAAYARAVLELEQPRVCLLNIGTEDLKGTDVIRSAAATLRRSDLPMRFEGFIEGNRIASGDADVIVTEGFVGNVALKTTEGTARFITDLLQRAFSSSIRSKIGFLISKPAMHLLKHHLDPNNHNGGVFLGLNGVVVKSHGNANVKGVANAIDVAARLVADDIIRHIGTDLTHIESPAVAAVAN